ncbi:hypothetical protein Tco_0315783 [Tanacetum coccineum]
MLLSKISHSSYEWISESAKPHQRKTLLLVCRAKEQEKKRCEVNSTDTLHKGHKIEEISTPRRERLIRIRSLSNHTLQAKILTLDGTTFSHLPNAYEQPSLKEISLQENTGYWQQPSPYEATTQTSSTKKKATRNRQKRQVQTDDAPRQVAWTTEKEIMLARGSNPFLKTASVESGARDEDYVPKAMVHYQAETGLPFKFYHCWDVLKDSLKFQDIAFLNLNQWSQGSSKRHKSSGSRASSTMNDDALARLVVNEMTTVKVEQREAFIELKRREVECREREIAAMEYRAQQEDMKLYLQSYDHLTGEQRLAWDEVRAKIKAKYNLQF